ncbi:MAG TPA: phosphoribosylanthranilate isomerase [Herpetosiphonaceae bacterium]|nr:phosphoribosylanthranilate isomerase [Herpetosiphonaceae bacterium]
MNPWPRQLVKVCGIRTVEHALTAAQAGADCIGMIFAPGKRQITPEQGRIIVSALREAGHATRAVGVFVNETAAAINEIADQAGLAIIQLSGDEPVELADLLGRPLLKALRLTENPSEQAWRDRAAGDERLRLLVDAHVAGSYGGAGVLADWERAGALARQSQIVLAGGLDPANVAAAIASVRPWGVDVSSGVETGGIKDNAKIIAFVEAAQQALTQPI